MSSSEEEQLPKSSRLAIPKFDQLKDFDKSSSARRDATCKKGKLIKQATRSANNVNESDTKSSGQKRLNLSSARVD